MKLNDQHADQNVEDYFAAILGDEQPADVQPLRPDVSAQQEVTDQAVDGAKTGTSLGQLWPSRWLPSYSAKDTCSRSDWQLPRDSNKPQSTIVGLASIPVRVALKQADMIVSGSGLDLFGWTENLFTLKSSLEIAMPVGDEAV